MSMPEQVDISVDGRQVTVAAGISVAAAVLNAGGIRFRDSVAGSPRAPLCGMGICFECRVEIDDMPHARSCMVTVRHGMDVRTAAADSPGRGST